MEEIANELHISHGSVSTTLHDRLGMHKLTPVYSALLKRFRSKEDDFLSRLVRPGSIIMSQRIKLKVARV